MFLAEIGPDGSLQLGEDARRAGYRPGTLVQVIITRAAGTLILALHDEPVMIDAPARRLPAAAAAVVRALRSASPGVRSTAAGPPAQP